MQLAIDLIQSGAIIYLIRRLVSLRKLSQMGSSKYEFNPEKFDIDVANNHKRFTKRKEELREVINDVIKKDPSRMEETVSIIINELREIKKKYNI